MFRFYSLMELLDRNFLFRYNGLMTGTKSSRGWLKRLRVQAGLTALELAQKLGITPRLVRHWEFGTRDPGRHVYALARVLGPEVHVHLAAEELAPPSGEEVA